MPIHALARPLLGRLPPELAHGLTLRAVAAGLGPRSRAADPPALGVDLFGRRFPNPLGLAAGFDKNAKAPAGFLAMGFGFVEVGGVTPRPQAGNPRPRVFRDAPSGAVINRLGLNNDGLEAVVRRLRRFRERAGGGGLVGVNLGPNRDQTDPVADYRALTAALAPLADFLTLNVSSPNTAGLRALQAPEALAAILEACRAVRDRAGGATPILVKIAPDLTPEEEAEIARALVEAGADGLVVSNSTVARAQGLDPAFAAEAGGLSGRPLMAPSTALLARMARRLEGRMPLIGVGGIASAEDAYAKIRAGASLVELYTALVYQGPGLIDRIRAGLARLLARDGFASVAEAVGADLGQADTRDRPGLGPCLGAAPVA